MARLFDQWCDAPPIKLVDPSPPGCTHACLDSAGYGENYQNQKNQSDSSYRIVAPAGAIGPCGEGTNQEKD